MSKDSFFSKHPYLPFIGPAVAWVLLFSVFPFLYAIYISFTNMHLLRLGNTALLSFVGFRNYLTIFRNEEFWISFRHMLTFTSFVIIFQFLFGFLLALLLNKPRKGISLVRTTIMLPWVVPPVALALIWAWIWRSGQLGLVNAILLLFGVHPVDWLGYNYAMFSIIITAIWIGVPFSFMIELASLQKIPLELYDSSAVDGVNKLQRLFYITLPLMRSTIMLNLIMITIATLGYFDVIYALTGGGPIDATEVLPLYMYNVSFRNFQLGRGSAIAVVILVVSIITTLIYLGIFKAGREDWNE
jgi:multiple sugar transport system permease protein